MDGPLTDSPLLHLYMEVDVLVLSHNNQTDIQKKRSPYSNPLNLLDTSANTLLFLYLE